MLVFCLINKLSSLKKHSTSPQTLFFPKLWVLSWQVSELSVVTQKLICHIPGVINLLSIAVAPFLLLEIRLIDLSWPFLSMEAVLVFLFGISFDEHLPH
jgi:hypothetical protein